MFAKNKACTSGGGLYNMGITRVKNVKFNENETEEARGGGAANYGLLILEDSEFFRNYANNYGGAIRNDGVLRATDTRFDGNSVNTDYASGGAGGAVYCSPTGSME